MGDYEPVCWCGHPHTNGPACPKYGCSCVLHAPFDEAVTDLPDAVVEAAAEVIHREVTWATGDDSKRIACAVLAAASGPWAEQLDAAKADRDQALLRLKRIIELEPVAHAAEQIRESDGSFTTEIAGVRLEKCDEYGRTKTTTDLAAALARNAELERDRDWWKQTCEYWHEQTTDRDHRIRLYNLSLEQAEARESALCAELDNLRDRVNALADQYEKDADESDNYGGELWSTTSAALRAIVRGSDDE